MKEEYFKCFREVDKLRYALRKAIHPQKWVDMLNRLRSSQYNPVNIIIQNHSYSVCLEFFFRRSNCYLRIANIDIKIQLFSSGTLALYFFTAGSHYVAFAGLECDKQTRLSLCSQRSACPCLPSTGMKWTCLSFSFFKCLCVHAYVSLCIKNVYRSPWKSGKSDSN